MNGSEQNFTECWRRTVQNIKDGADRVQATADAFPADIGGMTVLDLEIIFARHAAALADHSVAINCLFQIMARQLQPKIN